MNRLHSLIGTRFTRWAVAFELSLGLLACLLCWIVGGWPMASAHMIDSRLAWRDAGLGAVSAVPFLAGLVWIDRHSVRWLETLTRTVRNDVVPLFRGTGVCGLLVIAGAAGVGEELLFRGFLQQTLADWWGPPAGPWIAWGVASVLFGVCHSLCAAYAVIATLIGLALGGLWLATGHLLAPMTMHAVYDALALLYLVRWSRPAG